ncbi:MAG: serine/threonine protein kinase [Deltaproteobacteria bacterium]|nr:serine/threonine protein kinase [Deltaproteobacteria bacterium]
MDLGAGTMVTPSVRLVEKLGEGGMGSVWVADHLTLKTRVAVKFVSGELLDRCPEMAERFSREASLAAQLKSPHVAQIFDHGATADGLPFIVMELLEGESLAAHLAREGRLGLRGAAALVAQVAGALGRAHKLGIIHRDIKPDNLYLIESEYELFVKVLDFGIAKKLGLPAQNALTATGAFIGTPDYMSPEQLLDSKGADHRADLWALAVVAYEALTGTRPFAGATMAALFLAIEQANPRAPSELCPELGTALDAFFARALGRDMERRFGSAAELAAAFRRAIGSLAPGDDDWDVPGSLAAPQPVRRRISEPSWQPALPAQQAAGGHATADTVGAVQALAPIRAPAGTAVIAPPPAAAGTPAFAFEPWDRAQGAATAVSAQADESRQPSTLTAASSTLVPAGVPKKAPWALVALAAALVLALAITAVLLRAGAGSATGTAASSSEPGESAAPPPAAATGARAAVETSAEPSARASATAAPASATAAAQTSRPGSPPAAPGSAKPAGRPDAPGDHNWGF